MSSFKEDSTRITSAPCQASTCVEFGPTPTQEKSATRRPRNRSRAPTASCASSRTDRAAAGTSARTASPCASAAPAFPVRHGVPESFMGAPGMRSFPAGESASSKNPRSARCSLATRSAIVLTG